MLVPKKQLIAEIIGEYKGEYKVLDEWYQIINKTLPSPKRVTKVSLCHIMGILGKNGEFVLVKEKKQQNTLYKFE